MAIFPGAIAADSDLYVAVNQKNTTLTSGINNSTLTIPVVSTTGFPTSGFITIDSEIIHYTSVGAAQFNADLRGADSTSAASHSNGAFVYHNIVSAHHNALKDEIKAVEQFISDLVGRTNTQVQAPNGTVSLPGVSFASNTNTGLYRIGSNDIAIATNGVKAFEWNSSQQALFITGSVSTPGLALIASPSTGFYKDAGGNDLAITAGGVQQMVINGNIYPKVAIYQNADGSAAVPTYSWQSDTDTGMFRSSSNRTAFTHGGIKSVEFFTAGTSDATPYQPFQLYSGGGTTPTCLEVYTETTTGVTSTGKNIVTGMDLNTYFFFIAGADGSGNDFNDVINTGYYSAGGTPSVVSSYTTRGTPAARTYAHNGDGSIKLTMASGTYSTRVTGFGMTVR